MQAQDAAQNKIAVVDASSARTEANEEGRRR